MVIDRFEDWPSSGQQLQVLLPNLDVIAVRAQRGETADCCIVGGRKGQHRFRVLYVGVVAQVPVAIQLTGQSLLTGGDGRCVGCGVLSRQGDHR